MKNNFGKIAPKSNYNTNENQKRFQKTQQIPRQT